MGAFTLRSLGGIGRRLLPLLPFLLLPTSSCHEHLPSYARPEVELTAQLAIPWGLADFSHVEDPPPTVQLFIRNQTDQESIGQIVLEVPYQIIADVTLFLSRDPSRKQEMHASVTFTRQEDRLAPGTSVRVDLDQVPSMDDQGRPWYWGHQGPPVDQELTLQGTARIPGYDLTIPIPSYKIKVRY